jgi:hypothetical protein
MRLETPAKTEDNIAAVVAVAALQAAQVGEQARPLDAVGPDGFVVVDEVLEGVAADALFLGGPVAPAIGRFES